MESELVAGFMTEHSASVFVFFFLGEYSSLVLMSAFMAIFFLGGHHCPDLHQLIFEPFLFLYHYLWPTYLPVDWFYYYVNNFYIYDLAFYYGDHELKLINNKDLIYPEFLSKTEWISLRDEGYWNIDPYSMTFFNSKETIINSINLLMDKIQGSYVLGFKIITVVFLFIWVRASFPRMRYDQLMSLCWKELLPLIFGYILFTICLFYTFDMMPYGSSF